MALARYGGMNAGASRSRPASGLRPKPSATGRPDHPRDHIIRQSPRRRLAAKHLSPSLVLWTLAAGAGGDTGQQDRAEYGARRRRLGIAGFESCLNPVEGIGVDDRIDGDGDPIGISIHHKRLPDPAVEAMLAHIGLARQDLVQRSDAPSRLRFLWPWSRGPETDRSAFRPVTQIERIQIEGITCVA